MIAKIHNLFVLVLLQYGIELEALGSDSGGIQFAAEPSKPRTKNVRVLPQVPCGF